VHHRTSAFSARRPEFDKRNTKLIAVSVDDVDSTCAGRVTSVRPGAELNFPIIGDADRKVADLYDMIHPNANDT